jgi:hypothetical protein
MKPKKDMFLAILKKRTTNWLNLARKENHKNFLM